MNIKSRLNMFVRKSRDAAKMSAYEARALTNNYEACHGDFAFLPDYYAGSANDYPEDTAVNFSNQKIAFAR